MKVWTISVLLLFLVCLTIPFVVADEDTVIIEPKEKEYFKRTPADITYNHDLLAPVKEVVGWEVNPVEISIDGKVIASIPEDSPLFNVPATKECLAKWPYGTIQWVQCEGGL